MLQEAVAMLPYGLPSETPSPQLRLRLMAEVYQDALTELAERRDRRFTACLSPCRPCAP